MKIGMEKNDIDFFISKNEREIMEVIKNNHLDYQSEVVFSNLYIYLLEQKNKLTEVNVMGFVIIFVNKLKTWRNWGKEKGVNIMEHTFFKREKFDALDNVIDVPCINIDFDKYFNEYVRTIPNYLDRCILRDFYEQKHVNTIDDIMSFYSVSKRQAYEIKKKIEKLELELFNYIKSRL